MKTYQIMKNALQTLQTVLVLLLDWKSQVKLLRSRHISKSKTFISTSNTLESKRKCSKCGEKKPLDANHFQVVKSFKEGYSYYCNICSMPKKSDD